MLDCLKRYPVQRPAAIVLLSAALSACGGGDGEEVKVPLPIITTVVGSLDREPFTVNIPAPGSATKAVAQLKAAGVISTNQRCGPEASPGINFAGGSPTVVFVDIDVAQLALAIQVGFRQVSKEDLLRVNASIFDCALRSL